MRNPAVKILTALILFLSACAPSFYTYKNVRYDTQEEAIQAQQEDLNQISRQINAKNEPLYGKALLILPSRKALKERGFRGATREQIENPANEEAVRFIVDTTEHHYLSMGDVLNKSGLFEEVKTIRALYPGKKAFANRTSYDTIIYAKLEGKGRVGAYLITPKSREEKLVFVRNALPTNVPGFRFWLKQIEEKLKEQQNLALVTDAESIRILEKNMKTEQSSQGNKREEGDDEGYSLTEFSDEPALDQSKGVTYYVEFNPFIYEGMYSTELGGDENVAIFKFSDKREGSKEKDNHIGTIYGAVYHNPLYKIHSERSVSDAITDAMETLFMANGFNVNKYQRYSQEEKGERFLIRGDINQLWVGCFHDAEATVDIDVQIYDTKKEKTIWSGKIAFQEQADPSKIYLVPLLNKTLGKAFNETWNNKGMADIFQSLENKATSRQEIEELNTNLSAHPNDASIYLKLGIKQYDIGKYQDAENALKRAVEINFKNARAHYYLGVTQLIQGDKEAAVKQYEILRDLDENFAKKLFSDIYE